MEDVEDVIEVILYYFKPSGKYYGQGTLKIDKNSILVDNFYKFILHVEELQRSLNLPGLKKGARWSDGVPFTVFINGKDHPLGYPVILHGDK